MHARINSCTELFAWLRMVRIFYERTLFEIYTLHKRFITASDGEPSRSPARRSLSVHGRRNKALKHSAADWCATCARRRAKMWSNTRQMKFQAWFNTKLFHFLGTVLAQWHMSLTAVANACMLFRNPERVVHPGTLHPDKTFYVINNLSHHVGVAVRSLR